MDNLVINIKELENYSEEDLPLQLVENPKIQNKLFKHDYITYEKGYYKFKYVGILVVENVIIKCYPKYIKTDDEEEIEKLFKQVLKVIMKYDSTNDNPYETNELDDVSFHETNFLIYTS